MLNTLSSLLTSTSMLERFDTNAQVETLSEGENRFASILFADLHGFTALSEKLSPDLIQALADQLMLSFSERVQKYGGYVDKYEGDRIVAHFGSLSFLEQNSRRAVYAGLEIVEVIDKFNQLKPQIPELSGVDTDISVRVGINSGLVATGKIGLKREGDFTVYSEAVNLASRIEEHSPLQRVAVPESVKVELEGYFEFEFYTEFRAKGISKPISTWLVSGIHKDQIARKLSRSEFIGRDSEFAVLNTVSDANRSYLDQQDFSQPVDVVVLCASAGMGKTRLIREFFASLPQGSSLLAEVSPLCRKPFASFTSLVHNMMHISSEMDQDTAQAIISIQLAELQSFMPGELELQTPDLLLLAGFEANYITEHKSQSEMIHHLNYSILLFIQALALQKAHEGKVLYLAFDDMHFCDEASLNAIAYLIKNLHRLGPDSIPLSARIVFILAWRDGFVYPGIGSGMVNIHKIKLAELTPAQIELFLEKALPGVVLSARLRDNLIDKSTGNPLFLEEWINLVKQNSDLSKLRDLDLHSIPNNISAIILSRMNSLDKLAIRMLQDASAIGLNFRQRILSRLEQALGGISDPGAALQRAMDIHYIECLSREPDDSEYSFRHQIIHQIVYKTILSQNRKILHRNIATIIEDLYADRLMGWCLDLADHYFLAGTLDKAEHYLWQSLDLTRQLGMNSKALECCQRLISLSTPEKALSLRLIQATIHLNMGNFVKAEGLITALDAGEIVNPDDQDMYILAKTRLSIDTEELTATLAYLEAAFPNLHGKDAQSAASIYLLDIKRQLNAPDFPAEAQKLSRLVGMESEPKARFENILGLYYHNQGQYEQALLHYDLCLESAQDLLQIQRWACQNKANALCKTGRQAEAMRLFQCAHQLCKKLDDEAGAAKLGCDMACHYLNSGELDKALRLFNESLQDARQTGNLKLQGLIIYNLAVCHFEMEDYPKAQQLLKDSIRLYNKLTDLPGLAYANDLLGDICYRLGKLALARKTYQNNLVFQRQIKDQEGVAHTYGNLGNIAADNKDWPQAEAYYQKQVSILHKLGDLLGEARAWFNWAILDDERGLTGSAITRLRKAKTLFHKGGFGSNYENVESYLSELKEKMK